MRPLRFPDSALVGSSVPKSRVYANGSPSKRTKEYMIREVEAITWEYKLSPETVNIPRGEVVEEIQVFRIELKDDALHTEVLKLIDRAIPSPILFMVSSSRGFYYAAAYKRPNESNRMSSVIGEYFFSKWFEDEQQLQKLPISLNLDVLYRSLLEMLLPIDRREGEGFSELLDRVGVYRAMLREVEQLKNRVNNERQFNRKVELNHRLRRLRAELETLQH